MTTFLTGAHTGHANSRGPVNVCCSELKTKADTLKMQNGPLGVGIASRDPLIPQLLKSQQSPQGPSELDDGEEGPEGGSGTGKPE